MALVARPASDNSPGLWLNEDATLPLWSSLDEVTPDAGDYIWVDSAPFAGDPSLACSIDITAIDAAGSGGRYLLRCFAKAQSGSGLVEMALLSGAGAVDSFNLPLGATNEVFEHLVDASVASISSPGFRFTLTPNGSSWTPRIHWAELRLIFPHLDRAANGYLKTVAAGSGHYMMPGSNGFPERRAGYEESGALVRGSNGFPRRRT